LKSAIFSRFQAVIQQMFTKIADRFRGKYLTGS
jgi:hypothetical protein